MSLIKEYVTQRRKRKLEEVTHALEQLKHQNVATDAFKPKSLALQQTHAPLTKGKDTFFIGFLILAIVLFIILTFYYRHQYDSLNQDYTEKVSKLKDLEAELGERLQDLNDTKEILKDKEQLEKELSGRSQSLQDQINDLQTNILDKKDEINNLTFTINNLTLTIGDQRREIAKWKNCVEDEYNGNLSIC